MNKIKKISIIFASILCAAAAVAIPTTIVLSNKSKTINYGYSQIANDFSNQLSNQIIDQVSDSNQIQNYIGSYDSGTNEGNQNLGNIVDGLKSNLDPNLTVQVSTSYLAPEDNKVAIDLQCKFINSKNLSNQQTINKPIKTDIDAIEFNNSSFIDSIKSLNDENVSDVLNNLQQNIVNMNVGVDPGDLSNVEITTNPIDTPSALTAEVSDNNFTPYTLSFAFTSSNSALFYNPSESNDSSTKTYTPNYSSSYNVQNVNVLQEETINLDTISNNFSSLNGIYSLFNESTSLFDSEKIINLLCKDNSGLNRDIIDSVSVSSTSHDPATFNITGMNIDVTFKYPYYVNSDNNSESASAKIVKDVSLNKYVATIQLTNLNTTVFDLNNADQLYNFQDSNEKTIITGLSSTGQSLTNTKLYLPANVTQIANNAFADNTTINSIDMSTAVNLNSIGNNAFHNCSSLTSVVFNNKLTYIGKSAFDRCQSLTSPIIIPASVTKIDQWCFGSGPANMTIYLRASYTYDPADSVDGPLYNAFLFMNSSSTIYVVDEQTKVYVQNCKSTGSYPSNIQIFSSISNFNFE